MNQTTLRNKVSITSGEFLEFLRAHPESKEIIYDYSGDNTVVFSGPASLVDSIYRDIIKESYIGMYNWNVVYGKKKIPYVRYIFKR